MDIASLRSFAAVADSGSFTQASEDLHLTQPAVSKRIAALEHSLGQRLFDRIGRRVSLTEAGRALLPHARRIIGEIEDGRRAIANLGMEVAGRLKTGTSHHIGLHHLPPILRAFTARYPQVQLDLAFMDSEAACRAVAQGELDIGIVTLPPDPQPALMIKALWPDPLCVVCAPDHPLNRHKVINIRALADHPAILPAESTYTRQIFEQALAPLGLELKTGLSTNYLETIKMLVSVGLGWSVLPATLLDPQLVALNVDEISIQRTLGAVWHRDRTLPNAANALLDMITAPAGGSRPRV